MSFKKNTAHILVLRERVSMFTLSAQLSNKTAAHTAEKVIELMKNLPTQARKSMTFDNGGEFTEHMKMSNSLGLRTFFSDPYASWQKGGVENTNGRLRRDLPRNTDIKAMSQENFDETLDNYNDTPRKSLKWFTPREIFYKNLHTVALRS